MTAGESVLPIDLDHLHNPMQLVDTYTKLILNMLLDIHVRHQC